MERMRWYLLQIQITLQVKCSMLNPKWYVSLMCLAINGYYGVVNYKWRKEGNNEIIETTPLFFLRCHGTYTCNVALISNQQHLCRVVFEFSGISIYYGMQLFFAFS